MKKSEQSALAYRTPMAIKEIRLFFNGSGYYVCPQCKSSLDREYMAFCDRCGQRLRWKGCAKAEEIYILRHAHTATVDC